MEEVQGGERVDGEAFVPFGWGEGGEVGEGGEACPALEKGERLDGIGKTSICKTLVGVRFLN